MTGKQKHLEAAAGVSQGGSARPGLILGGILLGAFILRTVGANQVFSAVEMPVTSLLAGFRLTLPPGWAGTPSWRTFSFNLFCSTGAYRPL